MAGFCHSINQHLCDQVIRTPATRKAPLNSCEQIPLPGNQVFSSSLSLIDVIQKISSQNYGDHETEMRRMLARNDNWLCSNNLHNGSIFSRSISCSAFRLHILLISLYRRANDQLQD